MGAIGDDLAAKLAAVGLIHGCESRKLKEFLDNYIGGRQTDGHTKGATLITIRRVADDLVSVLGDGADLRAITFEEAEQFKQFYQDKELAPATTYRRLKMAKMLFNHAVKLKLVPENPFADVKGKNSNPIERRHYFKVSDALKLIDAANPTWRTIIALARFAGLRCPSEVLSLRWENVDFVSGRMTVSSPKTEHLEGRAYRVVPIFAQLRQHLEDAPRTGGTRRTVRRRRDSGSGLSVGRKPPGWIGQFQHADNVREAHPPCGASDVAAVVPQLAGEL